MTNRTKIASFQGWRFLFAIAIILCHLRLPENLHNYLAWGAKATIFFFIISGFLSAQSDTTDIKEYYKKKFLTIFPIHWICFLLTCILLVPYHSVWNADTWWIAILNVSLLHAWLPRWDVVMSFYGPSWFLSVLVFFYIILPLLQRLRKKSMKGFYTLVVGWIIVAIVIVNYWWSIPHPTDWNKSWIVTFFPFIRVLECILGMCLYDLQNIIKKSFNSLYEVGSALMLIAAIIVEEIYDLQIPCTAIAISLIILIFANSNGIITRILSTKIMVFGGDISMEIYMSHLLVIIGMGYINVLLPLPLWLNILLVFIITFLVAGIYAKYINPFIRHKLKTLI